MKTRRLEKMVKRLRLKDGDLIVLRSPLPAGTATRIMEIGLHLKSQGQHVPSCGIVPAGYGDITALDLATMARHGWVRAEERESS